MSLRPMQLEDIDQAIECFKDAYGENYYRPEVYTVEGWKKWMKDPFTEFTVCEMNNEVAAIQADFWNEFGWIEYGALAARHKFRGKGIGNIFTLRNNRQNLELLHDNYVLWTIPYNPVISNAAREYNSIFGGVNGIYRLDNRVIFSVYYGWNERRILNRVPCYIPPKMEAFFEGQVKFIQTKFRRMYGFKNLKNVHIQKTDTPVLNLPWNMNHFLLLKKADTERILQDVKYVMNEKQKIIYLTDITLPGNGLDELMKKASEGYVFDVKILLCSKMSPKIIDILEKHGFKMTGLQIAAIAFDHKGIIVLKKAKDIFPEKYLTGDLLQMTTTAERKCNLINRFVPAKTDPNVQSFLENFPLGNVIYADKDADEKN